MVLQETKNFLMFKHDLTFDLLNSKFSVFLKGPVSSIGINLKYVYQIIKNITMINVSGQM